MDRLPEGVRRIIRLRRKLRAQVADEVDEEITFHLETRVEQLMAEGLDWSSAARRAQLEFGDIERARLELRHESERIERRARVGEWVHDLSQDLRYGWRKLWARPSFAIVAILTLALGLGANTAIFSVVNAVLLRPLPYPDPARLVQIWEVTPSGDDHNVVSRGNFLDWRDRAESFSELGAYSGAFSAGLNRADGEPLRISSAAVTPGVFSVLHVSPRLGRAFAPEEGLPGNSQVVVLSNQLWQTQFGADPAVIGSELMVDEESYTIIGVMPENFDFPTASVDLWLPWELGQEDRQSRRSHNLMVIGRLAPDVAVSQAQAELDAVAAGIAEEHPEYMTNWGVNVLPFRADLVASVRPLLVLLLGVVALVLLIACANLANLLLARALARDREVAVRCALGAGRGRLLRQFLTEAALMAALGGAVGLAITAWGIDLFVALAPSDIPLIDDVRVDLPVFAFTLGATVAAALLFGLLPAVRAATVDPQGTLRAGDERAGGARHLRLRAGLLVFEVALSVLLLVGAALLLRSLQQLQRVDYGFDPAGLLVTNIVLPAARYEGTPQQVEFVRSLTERTEALPGVAAVAATSDLPGGGWQMTFSFAIENRPSPGPSGREDPVPLRVVTPGFFRTMRIPLLSGRVLDQRDVADAPPAMVINESLARLHWPDSDPVGQRISFQREGTPEWWEIVGVVGDTRLYATDEPATPALYMTYAQKRWDWLNWTALLVRPQGGGRLPLDGLRTAIQAADPALAIGRIETVVARYSQGEARRRFAAALLVAFAALALVLGVVGIYGVLSYSVAQRTREIGVRIALGASRSSVAAAVVRQGLVFSGAGVVIGLAAALALSRFIERLVFGVTTTDATTYVAVPVVVLIVSVVAAYLPASRATRIDPGLALRSE